MHHSFDRDKSIEIRPASPEDAQLMAQTAAAAGTRASVDLTMAPSAEDVRAFLQRPDAGALVAFRSGRHIGTVSYVVEDDVLQMFRLAVLDDERADEIATRLVEAMEHFARSRGSAILYTRVPKGSARLDWYEHRGFAVESEEVDVVGGLAVVIVGLAKIV